MGGTTLSPLTRCWRRQVCLLSLLQTLFILRFYLHAALLPPCLSDVKSQPCRGRLHRFPSVMLLAVHGFCPLGFSLKPSLFIPCDLEDLVDAAVRHLQQLRLPFCRRVIAARPQPLPSCATLLVIPDWAAYAALSVVCLDLRDLEPRGQGPLVAAYVSRPTCKAELCRQAGIFGVAPCEVYVGTDSQPLLDDEAIHLANGCVVTLVQQDVRPIFTNDLQYRLQFPDAWPVPCFPPMPPLRALLLLHQRGRYLFRLQADTLPADEVAARFIGVERASVDIHTPAGDGCASLMHQGVGTRGVLAFVDRHVLAPDSPQYVVFLDLRQVARGIKFLALDRPFILRTEIAGIVGRQPPPSWRVRVIGGRMRRDRLVFQPNDTLVFGFEFVEPDSASFAGSSSSTTPAEEDSDDVGDAEGGESESAVSDATTRSRSRQRGAHASRHPDHSPDYSYQGGLDDATSASRREPAAGPTDPGVESAHPGDQLLASPPPRTLLPDPGHTAACCLPPDPTECVSGLCGPALCGTSRQHRVPEGPDGAPPLSAGAGQDRPALPPFTRRGRQAPGLPPPIFTVPRPDLAGGCRRTCSCWEYCAHEILQLLRAPLSAELFPALVPVHPQPLGAYALCIAIPSWTTDRYIMLDCSRVNGTVFCALCADVTNRASLLAIARLPRDPTIEVYVHDRVLPLGDGDAIGVRTGFCVIFVLAAQPPFAVTDLDSMLNDPLSWDRTAPLPGDGGFWLLLLTDDEPLQLQAPDEDPVPSRAVVANALHYDPARLLLQPTAPTLCDHFDFGIWCSAIFIASQEVRSSLHAVPYVLDMRPVLCSLTWGVADRGRVFEEPILRRFRALCPVSHQPALQGGRPDPVEGLLCRVVEPGHVLTVIFREVTDQVLSEGPDNVEVDSEDTASEGSASSSGGSAPDAPPFRAGPGDAPMPVEPGPPYQQHLHCPGCAARPEDSAAGSARWRPCARAYALHAPLPVGALVCLSTWSSFFSAVQAYGGCLAPVCRALLYGRALRALLVLLALT